MCVMSDVANLAINGMLKPFTAGQFDTPETGAANAKAPGARQAGANGIALNPSISTALTPPTKADSQNVGATLLLGG